jgi:hypothetical protein
LKNSRPLPCVPAAACPRLSAPRAPLARRPSPLWVSLLGCWRCAPSPDPDGGARHRARLSMPASSPPSSRYHPLPAGCVCAAAGFLAPMPTRLRRRPSPAAARPAAMQASERRATRYIRGSRTKIIWGTMGVRHAAHTDTRAKSKQRPTHLLSCFEIESLEDSFPHPRPPSQPSRPHSEVRR